MKLLILDLRKSRFILTIGFICLVGASLILTVDAILNISSTSILLAKGSSYAWSGAFAISEILDTIDSIAYVVACFCLLRFYLEYLKTNIPFSTRQSQRMLISALCYISIFITHLLQPVLPAQDVSRVLQISIVDSGPSLQLLPLLMAGFFFVLSAVFRHGNAVQEDSDSIL